jgi:hypothetical protein
LKPDPCRIGSTFCSRAQIWFYRVSFSLLGLNTKSIFYSGAWRKSNYLGTGFYIGPAGIFATYLLY